MEWHVKNGSGSNSWEWDMFSGSSGSERYERLPMAEWAGSDQEPGFNISKEFHFKAHNAMDHENPSMSLIGGSGLSDVVSGMDRGVKILKNENGDMKGGWLVDSGMANNNNQKSNGNGNGLLMGCLGGGNSEESSVYNGIGSSMSDLQGDSLTCLKLGKRQYYEDSNTNQSKPLNAISLQQSPHHPLTALNSRGFSNVASPMVSKKTRANSSSNAPAPRCQVEGCNVLLTDAKEYHKRHKVCESHSKTPKVIVNSLEQRFCQQCSRFHQISEFDDTKRSCRRRLAGHNERRRKSSSDALHNSSLEDKRLISAMGERFCYGSYSVPWLPSSRRALSLLSSQKPSWITSTDIQEELSFRSNAALKELIAQNRAQSHSRNTDYEHRGLSKPVSMFQGAGQTMQDQQDMQDNMEICRVMPELRSLEINNVASGRLHLYNSHELKEHNYGLVDSNVVARPTLDLMQHHSNSLYALHSRSNASSSSSSSEEKCGFWKSVEGVEIE